MVGMTWYSFQTSKLISFLFFVTDPKFRQCANSFYQLFPRFAPLWRDHKPSRSESLTGDELGHYGGVMVIMYLNLESRVLIEIILYLSTSDFHYFLNQFKFVFSDFKAFMYSISMWKFEFENMLSFFTNNSPLLRLSKLSKWTCHVQNIVKRSQSAC